MKPGFLMLLLLVLVACAGAPTPTISADALKFAGLNGNAIRGKEKYIACVSCHGLNAQGLPGLGKNLTAGFARSLSDADLILLVTQGRLASDPANTTKVDMPARGGDSSLTDQDLADIVAYVRTLQK